MRPARKVRRPYVRRSRKQGRQGLWFRQESFSPTAQDLTQAFWADTLVTPSDWERDDQVQTQPARKGGARIERSFCQFSCVISYNATAAFQITPAMEVLNYAADRRIPLPTNTTSFALRLEENRVMWHHLYPRTQSNQVVDPTIQQVQFSGSWESPAKVRLTDQNVGLAFYTPADLTAAPIIDVSFLCVWTAYITTP